MGEANPDEFEIRQNPVSKLLPLVLGMMTLIWGLMACFIPGIPMVGRIIAWALIISLVSDLYLTAARRLVVGEDGVDIELSRKTARIPYASLDQVTVRAVHLGGALHVRFVTKRPPGVIRARIGLTSDEVLKIAPQLIRALIIRGVDVRVPGRPDVGTGGS